ncbi:hypothetical protein CEUSTIGMA_g12167.t1 [Chlamydomonas eustigma]|uniref:A to I editase domain-containing protein n=1 Tax=Chlamydomonas eustigma TaxID=1157962 RepID=A0A250XNS4_9CHLO|nr:hypothetical protein CEUSTIGMA_g12167.t1 [Chlamydomonas eustigma]|eukprot:GAX84745.1 hypothetical protein CEUSTIGMA_g12167.t1 [Chlamydomonas eustigma]
MPGRSRFRQSTCEFANVVKKQAEFKAEILGATTNDGRHCLAAFLITDAVSQEEPKVIALGVGTKFLPNALVRDNLSHGRRVNDSHAEILARRGLLRWLHLQIRMCLKQGFSNAQPSPSQYLEKAETSSHEEPLLRLRDGVSLHFYCSSCPCGNATLRRWAATGKGGDSSLGAEAATLAPHLWPDEVHPVLSRCGLKEGQVQLLVKLNPKASASNEASSAANPEYGYSQNEPKDDGSGVSVNPVRRMISCDRNGIIPPGTEVPGGLESGLILSCSDKMALWAALGVQGSLLSRFLQPIFITTITVNRKFSRSHLRRALCCRLGGWRGPAGASTVVRHPVLLSPTTSREFDEEGEEDPSAFGSGRVYCWWEGAGQEGAVCLNGRTGLLWTGSSLGSVIPVTASQVVSEEECGRERHGSLGSWVPVGICSGIHQVQGVGALTGSSCWWSCQQECCWGRELDPSVSPISKAALLDAYMDLCHHMRATMNCSKEGAEEELGVESWSELYRRMKREASSSYDIARMELLSSPYFFTPAEGTPGHPEGATNRQGTGFTRKCYPAS